MKRSSVSEMKAAGTRCSAPRIRSRTVSSPVGANPEPRTRTAVPPETGPDGGRSRDAANGPYT